MAPANQRQTTPAPRHLPGRKAKAVDPDRELLHFNVRLAKSRQALADTNRIERKAFREHLELPSNRYDDTVPAQWLAKPAAPSSSSAAESAPTSETSSRGWTCAPVRADRPQLPLAPVGGSLVPRDIPGAVAAAATSKTPEQCPGVMTSRTKL